MKLKPIKKLAVVTEESAPEKKPRKKSENKLPKDGYEPIFKPMRFLVRETRSWKDNSVIKQYMEISVKRIDDDNKDEATPYVWIQMYQESDFYTGYLKGKTVYLPLEMLYDLVDNLNEVSEECDRRNIQ